MFLYCIIYLFAHSKDFRVFQIVKRNMSKGILRQLLLIVRHVCDDIVVHNTRIRCTAFCSLLLYSLLQIEPITHGTHIYIYISSTIENQHLPKTIIRTCWLLVVPK